MKDRHQYYLDNKERIKAQSKKYYLKHKDDEDYRSYKALINRRYYRKNKEKEAFYKEFKELKDRVLYLEALLGINNRLTT